MNLMVNAIDAMNETGGELTLRSELDRDGRMMISVSDTGVGLPAEKADQIFNAFFTTKPHGSGMGLAISRSIISRMAGVCGPRRMTGGVRHFVSPCQSRPSLTLTIAEIPSKATGNTDVGCVFGIRTDKRAQVREDVLGYGAASSVADRVAKLTFTAGRSVVRWFPDRLVLKEWGLHSQWASFVPSKRFFLQRSRFWTLWRDSITWCTYSSDRTSYDLSVSLYGAGPAYLGLTTRCEPEARHVGSTN